MRAAKAIPLGTAVLALASCGRSGKSTASGSPGSVSAPVTMAPGAPRAGMVWVPAGVLRAGTPLGEVPRIADTEMPGVEVAMAGFYIDELPWPNEAGAIPTTNVSREEAQRLCEGAGLQGAEKHTVRVRRDVRPARMRGRRDGGSGGQEAERRATHVPERVRRR